jgi:Zn-dependent M28 family amino/carboxypeptidase
MKRFSLLIGACMALNALCAQTNDAAKYAATITTADLQKHLTIIAGDEMQGRETGTEGQRKAAAYIEQQFRAIGLQPAAALNGYQQFYPLYKDTMTSSSLTLGGKVLEYGKDYTAPLTANATKKVSGKKIIFIGYGISTDKYDDYAGKKVKGKIVVFFSGEPKLDGNYVVTASKRPSEWTMSGQALKLQLAKEKGAVAAIMISPTIETFNPRLAESSKKTNVYYPRNSKEGVNAVTFSHEAARSLLGSPVFDSLLKKAKANLPLAAEAIKDLKVKFLFDYSKNREVINASNVLGIVEGTDKKDEIVFLTGHYDHLGMRDGKIFYGADDDGSGTVAVIEMAEAFAKAKAEGKGPRRTVIFMTVSGEEKGLWGSEYYSDHPVFPLEKTSVDLNIDMVGRIDTERKKDDTLNYVYVIGHNKLSSDLPVINEGVNNKYTNLVLDYKYDDPNDQNRIYFRSDHYNFARKGVPILFFYDGMLKADYHKTTDTIDKITWSLFEKRVHMIFHTAWEIANRNDMLKRDIPLPEGSR